jgi:hypothetical protein
MKLHIVGATAEDKGRQLETITREILESLGYQRLQLNVESEAGEVDVQGVHITPAAVDPIEVRVIAECKAHKNPLNLPDWLKFLGKVHIARQAEPNAYGCLIALSGVNGHVLGSYSAVRGHVRLVDSSHLIEYLARAHHLAPQSKLVEYLNSSGRTYLGISLVYYNRHVYWLVGFDGAYTLLAADVTKPNDDQLATIRPLVEAQTDVGTNYVDLAGEEKLAEAHRFAVKCILGSAMRSGGSTTAAEIMQRINDDHLNEFAPEAVVTEKLAELVEQNHLTRNGDMYTLDPRFDNDVPARAELFLKMGYKTMSTWPIGREWWLNHIDAALLDHACAVAQRGLELTDEQKTNALKLMKISPSALMYSLRPDGMITTHRPEGKAPLAELTPEMLELDRSQFMRSLASYFLLDWKLEALAETFFDVQRIEKVERVSSLLVTDRENNVVVDVTVDENTQIGEWHERDAQGKRRFIHMLTFRKPPRPEEQPLA